MDKSAIRLLLKYQSDIFMTRLVSIQAELEETKKLLQVRHAGGGDSGSALPRAMRLDVPKFNGTDLDSWIFLIIEYFALLNTLVYQRLKVVGFNLVGEAAKWFRWKTQNKLITDWDGFVESMRNCFGPSKFEDPQGMLSKLLQTGTVAQYQGEFEKLMNCVTDISETLLILFYISGLKPNLQRELLVVKPATLREVFALARVTEARLVDQQLGMVINSTTTSIIAERQERLNKGLCFNYDNKWACGHICPGKFLLLMAKDGEDRGQDMEADATDVVESGDISILNSLIGHGSHRSLQLWGTIGLGEVHVLIDNGSTHNFV
ncbi:ty3-gypsy retrotransposon protein [Tanacetum coccineum]